MEKQKVCFDVFAEVPGCNVHIVFQEGIDYSNEKISLSKNTDEDQALSSEKLIKLIVALQGD